MTAPSPASVVAERGGSRCVLSGLQGMCSLTLGKLERMRISSFVDSCVYPPQVDLNVELPRYGSWDLNFVANNPAERREFGPSFWPLWLRLDFYSKPSASFAAATPQGENRINQQSGAPYYLKACVQAAKTGERLCFLNQSVDLPPCATATKTQEQSVIAYAVISLIFVLLIVTLISATVIVYRRFRVRKRYLRHLDPLNSSVSTDSSQPPLPHATRYDTPESRRKSYYKSYKQDESLLYSPPHSSGIGSLYSPSVRESKLVQTSLVSLVPSTHSSLVGNHVTQRSLVDNHSSTHKVHKPPPGSIENVATLRVDDRLSLVDSHVTRDSLVDNDHVTPRRLSSFRADEKCLLVNGDALLDSTTNQRRLLSFRADEKCSLVNGDVIVEQSTNQRRLIVDVVDVLPSGSASSHTSESSV